MREIVYLNDVTIKNWLLRQIIRETNRNSVLRLNFSDSLYR